MRTVYPPISIAAIVCLVVQGSSAASDNNVNTVFYCGGQSNVGVDCEEMLHDGGAPPPPPPPAITFDPAFDDFAVLQQTPSDAFVFGATTSPSVTVTVSGTGCPALTVPAVVFNSTWKARVPGAKGGDCYFVATDGLGNSSNLTHVTYGDVWYCGGQSNMALPMSHTFSRNASAAAVLSGKYANIRLKQISTNMNPAFPWMTLHDAVANRLVGEHGKINDTYLNLFSATCYYFGESLTEELGSDAPPIGLIHTAYGGSMIEQWLTETTVMSCKNASNYTAVGGGEWWQTRVLPFSQMTLKGWAWYQGENNMHAMFGNSQLGTGYACLMAKLVSDWRALWAKSSGTDPMAPFGLVTLAASGGEGGSDIGSMRLAQTASYGVLPNPIMPNTFFAQAGDLDDPVGTLNCYHDGCCTNMSKSPSCTEGIGCAVICKGGSTPDYSWEDTPVYMGPIHPRGKKVLGVRFARAAAASVYGKPGAATGPTITGCALSTDKKTIIIKFNTSLFAGDSLEVNDYSKGNTSQMSVLVNEGKFCFQSASGKYCLDDGFGNFNSTGPVNEATDWAHVDIKLGSDPSTVEVDLTRANGTAFGVRFGWQGGGDCCADESPGNWFCESRSPVMLKAAQLPANPFMAKIVDGKCKCMPPQQCDE